MIVLVLVFVQLIVFNVVKTIVFGFACLIARLVSWSRSGRSQMSGLLCQDPIALGCVAQPWSMVVNVFSSFNIAPQSFSLILKYERSKT